MAKKKNGRKRARSTLNRNEKASPQPVQQTALAAVWRFAQTEWEEWIRNPGSSDPEHLFCSGYLFGYAFGLADAATPARAALVARTRSIYSKRGWID